MVLPPIVDLERLRASFGPGTSRAKRSGEAVAARRKALSMSQQALANSAGTTLQTIFRIERGELVPRDYLKAAIAFALFVEIGELWPTPSRQELHAEVSL